MLQTTSNDPLVGKVATAVIGMIVRFVQGLTASPVESSDMRYGIQRGLTFIGYLATIAQTDGKVWMAAVTFHLFEAPTLDIRL